MSLLEAAEEHPHRLGVHPVTANREGMQPGEKPAKEAPTELCALCHGVHSPGQAALEDKRVEYTLVIRDEDAGAMPREVIQPFKSCSHDPADAPPANVSGQPVPERDRLLAIGGSRAPQLGLTSSGSLAGTR